MHRLPRCLARIIGSAIALAACLLLAACSSVKLAYNNSPTLAHWWLDRYVNLEDVQSADTRRALSQLQQWHRRTELPKLADMVQRLQQHALADTTPEQVCAVFVEARQRLDALVTHAEPAAATLAVSLQPHQLAHIATRFEKTNVEWREDWMEGGADKRLDKRMKTNRERSEDFYGRLKEPQVTVLRTALERSDFDPQLVYRERVRRQQDLLQVLRQSTPHAGSGAATADQATQALRGYVERTTRSPDAAYRAWSDKAIDDGCRTVAEVHNSTTREQRERAAGRLREYERHLRELATTY